VFSLVVGVSDRKKLLLIGATTGYQTRVFAEAAERLGFELMLATDRCHILDDPWGDHALALRFEDPEGAAQVIASEARVNGIVAVGDRPAYLAALAAERLGIPYNSPDSVLACRNKFLARERFRCAGLLVPEYRRIALAEGPHPAADTSRYPCVLKPLGLSASRGVIRANNPQEFTAAFRRIQALLGDPDILCFDEEHHRFIQVESFIEGREFALEGILVHGQLRVLALFDKPDPLDGPYFEETIYVTPSRLPAGVQTAIEDCAQRSVAALGLVTGPVHAEFRVNDNGPWVLEIAPRPIGGLCSRALRFGAERISLEELLIRHALDLGGTGVEREKDASGVMMIPVPRSGIFEGVDGIEDAEKVAGVNEIRITARLHDYVAAWPDGSSYLGFIFARAAEPAEVESSLRAAHAKLHFRFAPRLPIEHPVTGKLRA